MADEQARQHSWCGHFPYCSRPVEACTCGQRQRCRCCAHTVSPRADDNHEAEPIFVSDEPAMQTVFVQTVSCETSTHSEARDMVQDRLDAKVDPKLPQLSEVTDGSTEAGHSEAGGYPDDDDDDPSGVYRGVRVERAYDFYDTIYRRIRLRKIGDDIRFPKGSAPVSRSDSGSSTPKSRSTRSNTSSTPSTPDSRGRQPQEKFVSEASKETRSPGKFAVENVTNWGVLAGSLLHNRVLGFADLADMLLREHREKIRPQRYRLRTSVQARAKAVVDAARSLARQAAHEPMDRLDSEWCEVNLLTYLFGAEYIDTLLILANTARTIVAVQPMLVRAEAPCRVFGDIHGQFRDLLLLLHAFGMPSETNCSFVFNGDFVDRGSHQLEVIGLLLALKVLLPDKVFLVRGNHEDRAMNEKYGFQEDCKSRLGKEFGQKSYDIFHKAFDQLPVACLVSERILVVHGGIGDGRWTLSDLEQVQRPLTGDKLYESSWIYNILWSDPTDEEDKPGRKGTFGVHASPRFARGQSNVVNFGWNVTKTFCARNGIGLVVRSHECKEGGLGFDVMHEKRLVRVFSARDYEGNGNSGAVLLIKDAASEKVQQELQDELMSSGDSFSSRSPRQAKKQFKQMKRSSQNGPDLLVVRPQVLQSVTQARQEAADRIIAARTRSAKTKKGTPSTLQKNSEFRKILQMADEAA